MIISLVLGVAGLLILILLLSMVFITLAESKEQQLVAEEEEEEEEEVEGQHREEEVEDEMTSGTALISSMKSQLARVVLPLGGLKARLEERNYIQVI